MPRSRRRANSEGGIPALQDPKERLKELWGQRKALVADRDRLKEQLKEVKATIADLDVQLGCALEDLDQPPLPFTIPEESSN